MAKSVANLWPQIVSWENLLLAYRRCRRRKRYKRPAAEFDFAWEGNLLDLQRELLHGTYVPGAYRHFMIRDPKPRLISAAPFRDRVVHHALVNVLEPVFERRFIFDSYACRRGKGTHRAVRRAQHYLRSHEWCLKTDIVRFFPNVDHDLLFALLSRSICDVRVLELVRAIITSGEGVLAGEASQHWFPGDDLFAVLRPRGLPIGNLTSQFFANLFLDPLDHFIKETLRVPGYVRYSDDLVLFGNSKAQMWEWRDALQEQLAKQRLRLHADKTHVQPANRGVPFLGFHIFRDVRRLKQEALRRFTRRMRTLRWERSAGKVDFQHIRASLRAWLVHAGFANSFGIRRDMWRHVHF